MTMKKVTLTITAQEAHAVAELLGSSADSAIRDLASGFSDLASGTAASIEATTQTTPMRPDLTIDVGALHINMLTREVLVGGQLAQLTPKEFDILAFLARNRGVLFTKEQIYEAVWGENYLMDDSNIMAFIRKIRKKIEPEPDNPRYIVTVWGIGYKMADI